MDQNEKNLKAMDEKQLDEVVGGGQAGCTSVKRLGEFVYREDDEVLIKYNVGHKSLCQFWQCKTCGSCATSARTTLRSNAGTYDVNKHYVDFLYCSHCSSVEAVCDNCKYLDYRSAAHDRCKNPAVMNSIG